MEEEEDRVSCLSMKSDWSREKPPDFREEPGPSDTKYYTPKHPAPRVTLHDVLQPTTPNILPEQKEDKSRGIPEQSQPGQGLHHELQRQSATLVTEHFSGINTPKHQLQSPTTESCGMKDIFYSLRRSYSFPSLGNTHGSEKTLTQSASLPDMELETSFEEFTPDITVDENEESFRFQCSCPGLYQCSVSGLLFNMKGEGEVVYRVVPWNRRLLAQHHKKPAGPLFDIKCLQQSVCQLHLPHCEIRSTGGCDFLSVAHVTDEGMEFIQPHKITETHVIINITGFSGFGNVKDEDSPSTPVRSLVLLFYRPPDDSDDTSVLSVLLLPKNIVLHNVWRTRKKLVGDERYIETNPQCKLQPNQVYTLSTCPQGDSVLVQPTEAEFDDESYDNYFPSFQVHMEEIRKDITLCLRDNSSQSCVWERRVCLSSSGRSLNLPPDERLLNIRCSFIDGISGPVLNCLIDKLYEKKVLTDSEKEFIGEKQHRRDKAAAVIDTARNKGASSQVIDYLSDHDPFFCEHIGLI